MSASVAVVSVSGGKDSTATALLALEQRGRDACRFVFADTGNEHPLTLQYVHDYLPARLGIQIETVREDFAARMARKREYIAAHWEADGVPAEHARLAMQVLAEPTGVPFLDLCLWKGRFPSRKAQFCTQELKRRPLDRVLLGLLADGYAVESWRGIRRDESQNRADAKAAEVAAEGWRIVHPIVDWTAAQVVQYVLAAGVALNPLYSQGMGRVGCMPCINVRKDELREIAARFPEHIDKVRAWESVVSQAAKRGWTTFFTGCAEDEETDAEICERLRIDQRVLWSRTARGGRQLDALHALPPAACSSVYGLCE